MALTLIIYVHNADYVALTLVVFVRNADHVVILITMCNVDCVVVLMHRGAHIGCSSV